MRRQLLILALMLFVASSVFAVEVQINGLWYNLFDDEAKAEIIQAKNDDNYSGDIVIPKTVRYNNTDYTVTSIANWAFYECTSLTSITIPNSVTSIGIYAFENCSSLTSISVPYSVKNIGGSAFWGCSSLSTIVVNEGNAKFDSRNNCNAIIESSSNTLVVGCKNTTIPNTVKSIGSSAFQGCSGLTSITIPNGVTSIGGGAFYQCI